MKSSENRESAVAEFTRALQAVTGWETMPAGDVLRATLTALLGDAQALTRIYSSQQARDRLTGALASLLDEPSQFAMAEELFQPLHSLFTSTNMSGGNRRSIFSVLEGVLNPAQDPRPLVIIDVSTQSGADGILDTTSVKARILRQVCSMINNRAEEQFKSGGSLNALVVFDEAQRFAAESPEDDESAELAGRLVDYVRTTRKYGLGWMFITQEVGSLRRGIYSQLRVRCFGYGLTSGTELARLRETIGDPSALQLYRSFVDPAAITPSKFPFMLTGPMSPLSFTGAPVFLSVYTDFADFQSQNPH